MYNKAPYIERMVKSLSEQTYIDRTKIIVLDDCSTDDSVEILKRSTDKFGITVEIRSNRKNLGVSRTVHNMFWMVETPFWAMLDPDDYYIDPQRLERAVKFLEANPDHSMHGCNYFKEYKDGVRVIAIPESIPNYSSDTLNTMPFFQTSAGTFRNFWTENLLLYIDRLSGNARNHATEDDSFRNVCAINSGKVYFDNFIGSVYSQGVGIYNPMSQFEKDVMEVYGNYELFKFSRDFFHNETNMIFSLRLAYTLYLKVTDEIYAMMRDHSALKFQATNYFKTMLNLPRGDFIDVCRLMLDYCAKFEELGVGLARK